ncbi:MAG TPA: aldo/keto reductase, partial [Myxococcaceae bacterium]
EGSLHRLRVDRIDIYQLHAVDSAVPMEDSLGELIRLRGEGKIRHIGLSNVSVEQLERARKLVPVVSVQNRYNLADRASEDVLKVCERDGLGFLPWYPVGAGDLTRPGGAVDRVARAHEVTAAQVALAWLLLHSPVLLPIPGTSSVAHLEENVAAAALALDDAEMLQLERG